MPLSELGHQAHNAMRECAQAFTTFKRGIGLPRLEDFPSGRMESNGLFARQTLQHAKMPFAQTLFTLNDTAVSIRDRRSCFPGAVQIACINRIELFVAKSLSNGIGLRQTKSIEWNIEM